MQLRFDRAPGAGLRVLALGAHSDDIEIGCGATLLGLLEARSDVEVRWVVFTGDGPRAEEARESAALFLEGAADSEVRLHGFRDGFLPWQGDRVKEAFEDLKEFEPDLVLTHHGGDAHQDHRLLSRLTWNTFRSHLILEFEIPKYDGDLASPGVFVPVADELRHRKIDLLMEVFSSQRSKSWFTPETFDGLMRLRGIQCASPTGYAEGFHAPKLTMRFEDDDQTP